MRFVLSSTALSSKLNTLSKVLNNKTPLPILEDFVMDIREGRMYLTASDGENVMETSVELAESGGDMRIAIRSHDILDVLKGFSEQPLTIEIDDASRMATVNYLNGRLVMPVEDAADYPTTPVISADAKTITIPGALLLDTVTRSLFATAQDDLRPVMNGICFDMKPDCLSIVASDGHKLVKSDVLTITSSTPETFILAKKPATLLKGTLTKDTDTFVTIQHDGHNARIDYGEGVLTCRLIDGKYPNYDAVIPQNNTNEAVVDRLSLLSALKRVTPFANGSSNLVKFHIENDTLRLDAEDIDFAKTATEQMTCQYNGMPISIGFKGQAFIDALGNFECQDIIIKLSDSSRAGLVIPSEQPKDENVLMLLMPMLINE